MAESLTKVAENLEESSDPGEEFRRLCLLQAELLAREGVSVRAFRSSDIPIFSKLSEEKKCESISDIRTTLEIYDGTRQEGYELLNSPQLLWQGLRRFGWTPQSDIFGKLLDGDIVKIYSPNQKLIFCNLNFYKWISYSLEEVYTGYWYHLIRFLDERVTMGIYQAMAGAFSGAKSGTFTPDVPEHILEVLDPEKHYRFRSLIPYMSPLRKGAEVVGLLVICRPSEAV